MRLFTATLFALTLSVVAAPAAFAQDAPAGEARGKKRHLKRKAVKKDRETRKALRKTTRQVRKKAAAGDPAAQRALHTRMSIRKTNRVIRDAHQRVKAGSGGGKPELAAAVRTQRAARKAYAEKRFGVASKLTFVARDQAHAAATASGVAPTPLPEGATPEITPEVNVDEPLAPIGDEDPSVEGGAFIDDAELPEVIDDGVLDDLDGDLDAPAPAKIPAPTE